MKKKILSLIIVGILSIPLFACGLTSDDTEKAENTSMEEGNEMFSSRDLEQETDLSEAVEVELKSNEDVTITNEGVYAISGEAENSTIIVEADNSAKVQLVLNGADITNEDLPAIYVESADKVFITTTQDSENNLKVTEDGVDAVIFSKDDLTLNGLGTLNIVYDYGNGIESNDDLKITGGTVDINSGADGLNGNDSVRICDGNITIESGEDGIFTKNDDDSSLGFVYIQGGNIEITAVRDAIHGESIVTIDGGTLNITDCAEGIEGHNVIINAGDIMINASDDGINATDGSDSGGEIQEGVSIEVNGGNISVTVGVGDTDGLDSNGDIYINGGNVSVNGTSTFDANGESVLSGGTVTVNGEVVDELPTEQARRNRV